MREVTAPSLLVSRVERPEWALLTEAGGRRSWQMEANTDAGLVPAAAAQRRRSRPPPRALSASLLCSALLLILLLPAASASDAAKPKAASSAPSLKQRKEE